LKSSRPPATPRMASCLNLDIVFLKSLYSSCLLPESPCLNLDIVFLKYVGPVHPLRGTGSSQSWYSIFEIRAELTTSIWKALQSQSWYSIFEISVHYSGSGACSGLNLDIVFLKCRASQRAIAAGHQSQSWYSIFEILLRGLFGPTLKSLNLDIVFLKSVCHVTWKNFSFKVSILI